MVDEVQRQKQKPKRIRGGGKDLKVLENIKKLDSMKYTPPKLTEEEALEIINNNKEINGTEQEPQQAGSIFGQLRGAAQRPQ